MFSKLRHPVRATRESFGTPGLIIAVIALIAALGGTAIASGGLSGAEKKLIKKEAEKAAKKFAKAGPQGAPGAPGAKGANGTNGTNGTNGKEGPAGKSVEVLPGAAGCGTPGGSTVQVEGEPGTAQEICNGAEGSVGGGVLPPEQTEIGIITGENASANAIQVSFPLPLPAPLDSAHVKIINVGDTVPAECAGGTVENPKAAPGYLCAYNSAISEIAATEEPAKITTVTNPLTFSNGAARMGAIVGTKATEAHDFIGATYAVTAPEAP
jgi:hypothetical protein